ncbi:MAG: hypothetical protein WC587_03200 [Candidatus Paceibacterota bacterium]
MGQKIINFIKYNNAFTIAFVLVFFGFGISFAASPELRDGVYSSEEIVVSIDNSMIVSSDLDNFNFNLRISSITEDEKNYYAVYSYQTLAITDGFWQGKEEEKTLTVNKEALEGKDLGLYVAKELGENINYELSYLKRVQKLEKEKGDSQKIITVEYSGLVGKLLDPKEMVIEGYSPVIPEPVPEIPATVESNPTEVIVSTPYAEPQENPVPVEPAPALEPQLENPNPLPEGEGASAAEAGEVIIPPPAEPAPASSAEATDGQAEMIDEKLVQEVVEELLESEASSIPELSQ